MKYFSFKIFSILICLGFCSTIKAQLNPVAEFNFNDCGVSDATGNYADGSITGNIDCECGVGENSNALFLSGSQDSIIMDPDLKDIFRNDFSISFYFRAETGATRKFPIISISGNCDDKRDSTLAIVYLPLSDEISLNFRKNTLEGVEFRTDLDPDLCWQHILFTKQSSLYSLYINGEFIGLEEFVPEIIMAPDYVFNIGTSDCVGSGMNDDQYMRGRIDELKIFDRAISTEAEISLLREFPDQIISQDTTIFQGDSYQIRSGFTCANAITWSPTTGVMGPNDREPTIAPGQTTLYQVSYNHGSCVSRDQIQIFVISEDEVDCSNLLLPTAFTPNGDAVNDVYAISNAFVVDAIDRFEIFDRWGLKLFETTNKDEAWDGRFRGTIMPPGTYVYKIEYTCKEQNFRNTGSFNLLR